MRSLQHALTHAFCGTHSPTLPVLSCVQPIHALKSMLSSAVGRGGGGGGAEPILGQAAAAVLAAGPGGLPPSLHGGSYSGSVPGSGRLSVTE